MIIYAQVVASRPGAIRLQNVDKPVCQACQALGGCLSDTYRLLSSPYLRSLGWVVGYDFPIGTQVAVHVSDIWPLALLFFSLFLPTITLVISAACLTCFLNQEVWIILFSLFFFCCAVCSAPLFFRYFVAARNIIIDTRIEPIC